MTTATLKLYASLGDYLPANAVKNTVEIKVGAESPTVADLLARYNVPMEQCHLVLINGLFVPPGSRATRHVAAGDTLAVWPPVAGG